jgi:nicotinamide-nucleotide amidase
MVPRGCTVIPNKHGTAPGMLFDRDKKQLIVMPGVPYEMESMMAEFVIPYFKKKRVGRVILHRTLKTTGIPESFLAERLGNLKELLGDATLAFLPTPLGVRLRITVVDLDSDAAAKRLGEVEQRIRKKAEKYIYGIDDEELEHIVGRLLSERKLRIALAESCTGGLIANRMTNVPGSSDYFERGVVVYSNASKSEILGVPAELIEEHGAVSREVAEAMADGVRRAARTDIGISTTGIAGPTGGTPEKPVGLVWVGYSDAKESLALRFQFGDERLRFKERASQAALELIRRRLLKIEPQRQGKYD